MAFLELVSFVLGYSYLVAWSISFYPQCLLNRKRKSTSGTTVDFPLINCLGFLCYSIYNITHHYSPVIREQYAARNHGEMPATHLNDVVFSLHGLTLSVITTCQYLAPSRWGFTPAPVSARPSRIILGIMAGCVVALGLLSLYVAQQQNEYTDPAKDWCWLDVTYAISYVKVIVTIVKYSPQVLVNYKNKSTEGWSMWQIGLDFAGGVLNLGQLAVDAYMVNDWSVLFMGNLAKFLLSYFSMFYDVVFGIQHYILYPNAAHAKDEGLERERLLEGGDADADRRLD